MSAETSEDRFRRLTDLSKTNGTSWDVEAAKEVSALAKSIDWREAIRDSIREKLPEAERKLRDVLTQKEPANGT